MKKTFFVLAFFLIAMSPSLSAGSGTQEILSLPSLCESMGGYGETECKTNPAIKKFGCLDVKSPPPEWGALDPYVPLGICLKKKTSDAVKMSGCMTPLAEQYVVLIAGPKNKNELRLIKTLPEFKAFFAPVKNQKEAISYLMALTDSFPMYSFPERYYVHSMGEDGRYLVKNPKATEVKEEKEGFKVRLFEHIKCGCHVPELIAVDYFLSRDGDIQEVKRETVWRASRSKQICID